VATHGGAATAMGAATSAAGATTPVAVEGVVGAVGACRGSVDTDWSCTEGSTTLSAEGRGGGL